MPWLIYKWTVMEVERNIVGKSSNIVMNEESFAGGTLWKTCSSG